MKRKIKQNPEELTTLEGDAIPRPVRRRKGGLRLKAKHHRRLTKVLAASSACAILVGGTFGINALFFNKAAPNLVDDGFATVLYALPEDGSTPDMHSALENIGYMNARFRAQPVWYSEMDGNVNTMLSQKVNTWKQYSDGVLIQTDITTSSLINSAKQFCWVGDRVIWREAAGGPSTYNGIDTAWREGEPYGNMSVADYKATRGLPGTEFSVYVINEETLLDASAVTDNGDGTYSQTYNLDPATDKAPAYYVNQMMYTGGLTSLPTFEYITVTYTFDATWQVLSSQIDEAYTATKGVNAKCTADYTTVYEYGTDRAYSDAYESYFKNYADKPATGAPEGGSLTAADCLAEAFAPVLTQPVTFALDLTLDGAPLSGLVYVDVSDMNDMELRAQLGAVTLHYAENAVWLRYGDGTRVRMSVSDLASLLAPADGSAPELALDTDALLAQLGAGEFTQAEDGTSAQLSSTLSLFGMDIPVRFTFAIAEDGSVSLGGVAADLTAFGMQIGAELAYSQESVPALTDAEKQTYVDLMPYADTIADIASGDALALGFSYADGAFSLTGNADVMLADDAQVRGDFTLSYRGAKKNVSFAYAGGDVCLTVDGIRLKADVKEAIGLIGGYLTLPSADVTMPDLSSLLSALLSPDFAANFTVSEQDGALQIAAKGTQLLAALGVDFELGDVALSVKDGAIGANVLGVQLSLTEGEAFSVGTEGYTDAVALAKNVLSLLSQDYLQADVSYAAGELAVNGTVSLDMNTRAVQGAFTFSYAGAAKTAEIAYADGALCLKLEGMKLKVSVQDLSALLSAALGMQTASEEETDLLERILSLDFGALVSVSEQDGAAQIVLAGTQLLGAFGVDFALGDVELSVAENVLTARALGIGVNVVPGRAFAVDTEGYADASPVIDTLAAAIGQGRIALDGALSLQYRNIKLGLAVENGVLSWKDGFGLVMDLAVTANGTRQTISVDADASRVRIVYGTVGVELVYDELYRLGDTFEQVYARIAAVINRSAEGALPGSVAELSAQLGAGAAVTELLASLDLPSIIGGISFGGASDAEGSLATLSYGAFTFDLRAAESGLLLALGKTACGDVTLSGELGVSAAEGGAEQLPADGLMTVSDLCELLDFAGAAVATLASSDVTVTFNGATVAAADGSDVFAISGELAYHSGTAGGGFPVTVDRENTSVTVEPGAYVYFSLTLDDLREGGTDLYLDFWMFDAKADGELDFFVSISKYAAGEANCQPLRFAVSASDLLTILASGVSLTQDTLAGFLAGFGLPQETVSALFETLDAFFVSEWLTDTDKAQLSALGGILMGTLGIDAALEDVLGGLADAVGGAAEDVVAADPGKYLTSLGIVRREDGTIAFSVKLDSDLVYGDEGLAPLTIELTKKAGENGSLLAGVSLGNIYGNGNSENTGVSFGFAYDVLALAETSDGATLTLPDGSVRTLAYQLYNNYTFSGVDELIKSVAASATHEEEDGSYALNEQFYMSGSATLSIGSWDAITVGVNGLSVFVDASGNIAMHLKLRYDRSGLGGLIAFKSSGTTELTLKEGMAYLRRTLDGEAPAYRVMPASNFLSGILEQLVFMLNLSDLIAGSIPTDPITMTGGGQSEGDYGVILSDILSSYGYQKEEAGSRWTLNLNGPVLTGDVLDNIAVTLRSANYNGTDNVLRTLDVTTKLVDIIGVTANLTFRNPCGVWEAGASDETEDVSLDFGASAEMFAAYDWASQAVNAYLEPQRSTVRYTVDGEQAGEQDVWYAGDRLFTALSYPDLSGYEAREGYTLRWKEFAFVPGGTAEAVYMPNLYDVTFVSTVSPGDGWTENDDGTYSFATQMYYGAEVSVTYYGETIVYTMRADGVLRDAQGNALDLSAFPATFMTAQIGAEGAQIALFENPVEVTYANVLGETQTVYYEQGMEISLSEPEAADQTFFGWWQNTEEGWRQFTATVFEEDTQLEALWYSTVSGTMSGQRWYNGWFKDHHSNQIEMTGTFSASFASEIVLQSTDYRYAFDNSADTVPADDATGGTNSYQDSELSSKDYAHAKVTQIYTLNGYTITVVSVGHGKYSYSWSDAKTLMSANLTIDRITIA